jgi:hypothetical protein
VAFYNSAAYNQTKEIFMPQAQRAEAANDEQSGASRPVKSFRQGGVKVDVWRNPGQNGDMFNTTISNSYKDDATGEWKDTKSFSPTDLAVVSQLSSQAFQAIGELKAQSRGR